MKRLRLNPDPWAQQKYIFADDPDYATLTRFRWCITEHQRFGEFARLNELLPSPEIRLQTAPDTTNESVTGEKEIK